MIIFADKKTGEIIGNISGRIHDEQHLNMWIGDPKTTTRLVVPWKQTGEKRVENQKSVNYEEIGVDEAGGPLYRKVTKNEKITIRAFEPAHKQKKLFESLDQHPAEIHKYRLDLKTKELVKK